MAEHRSGPGGAREWRSRGASGHRGNPLDPQQANRLQLTVPSVTYSESLWATPSPAVGANLPNLGDQVWVQFEAGDLDYPVWIGVI